MCTGTRPDAELLIAAYDAVSQSARGERQDYRLERLPLAREGQAEVFRAEHKSTGTIVAFKKCTGRGERDARRMRREVTTALRFGGNPHVMPVHDFSPTHDWFVMPLAEATAPQPGVSGASALLPTEHRRFGQPVLPVRSCGTRVLVSRT